jgi:hypothetical protein
MRRVTWRRVLEGTALLVLAAGVGVLYWTPGFADDKEPAAKAAESTEPRDLSEFMRKKLDGANEILEGLCTEDAELVIKGAKTLNEMSGTVRFRVSTDAAYREFNAEYRAATKKLMEAADKKNFDAAALRWIDTTLKCIECHQFVRGQRIADDASKR